MLKKLDINYNKIILSLTFLLPFFDIYKTLIGNRFQLFGISVVEIFNFTFTLILFLMLFFKLKKENKKLFNRKMLLTLFMYIIYIVMHIIYILSLKDIPYLKYEVSPFIELYYILRSFILPLVILFVYMRSNLKVKDIIDTLSKVSFIFSIIIVITNILGVSLVAYSSSYDGIIQIKGNIFSWFNNIDYSYVDLYTSKGMFYSTNQISAILGSLLFLSAFYTLYEDKFINYVSFFIKILAAIMLSTKTAFLAIVFSILAIYIYSILKLILNKEKVLTKKSILFFVYLIIIMVIFNYSPIKYKLGGYVENLNNNNYTDWEEVSKETTDCISEETKVIENDNDLSLTNIFEKSNLTEAEKKYLIKYINDCPEEFNIPKEYIEFYPVEPNFDFWFDMVNKPVSVLSNYRNFKNIIYQDFIEKHNNSMDKWLGIGYSSNFPYMEIDFVGQDVWIGHLGVLLFILPYIILLTIELIVFLFNFKNKFNIFTVPLTLSIVYMIFASVFAGHVFGIVLPSTILALLLTALYSELTNKDIKENKLTFLLLHLGYGGIESSTINTANALCDKYEIELISFYSLSKNQVNKIDKRIKVKYLYNGSPNREEFVASIKEHKYIKTLKEGFKAVNILIKKRYLVIDAIIKSDSKYLVSTRWDFSILLSRYGSKSVIKIAQEHHYHNNDKKYLNILKHKYNNIDYLFALTQTLKDDYEKLLVNNKHTKVILVPNMLYNIPNVTSNLEEKNIITVSRLDYGKKNDDIIKAFSKIDNNDWKLYIIGDGLEFNNLTNLVSELNLKDRVILTGYKDKKEIEKYMLKSSIFLMASLTEGLPMVLLEAMSYGIPCIAYETASGVSDIIKNRENGYVIKDRDESLYIKKINKLIEDDSLRKNMGVVAKDTVNNFSKEEIKKIWLNILK